MQFAHDADHVDATVTSDARLRPVVVAGRSRPPARDDRWIICETGADWWIVDTVESCLCRAEREIDPRFVAPEHWQSFEAVWIGADEVRAELSSGVTVRAHRAA